MVINSILDVVDISEFLVDVIYLIVVSKAYLAAVEVSALSCLLL